MCLHGEDPVSPEHDPLLTCLISENHCVGSECFSNHIQHSKEPENTFLIKTNTSHLQGWSESEGKKEQGNK